MQNILTILLIFFLAPLLRGQEATIDPVKDSLGYELYLTQIALSETLMEMGLVGESKKALEKTDPVYRGLEYNYLSAQMDRSINALEGHARSVSFVTFSPDGRTLASAGTDSTIILWSYPELEQKHRISGHGGGVSTLDFSPDGNLIASGARDAKVKIWDTHTGELKRTISEGLSRGIYAVKFSPDGKLLGVTSWEFVPGSGVNGLGKIFRVNDGSLVQQFDLDPHPISAIDFSPDGKNVLIGSWGQIVSYHEIESGKASWLLDMDKVIPEEYNSVNSADLSPDGTKAVASGKDNKTRLFDVATGEVIYEVESHEGHRKWIQAVRFSPDGKYIATGAQDALLQVRDASTGRLLHTLHGHTASISSLTWHSSGQVLATASSDGTIRLWDLENTGSLTFDVCMNGPWYAPVSPDGKYMAAACSDDMIGIWNLQNGKRDFVMAEVDANAAVFSPDNLYLASAGHDKMVRIWDIQNERERLKLEGHTESIFGIDWNGNRVASAGDRTVRVWNATTGAEEAVLEFGEQSPYAVDFSPDGRKLAAGMTSGEVHLFDTGTWQKERQFKGGRDVNSLTFDAKGEHVLSVGTSVFVHQLETGRTRELKGHTAGINGLAVHPGGRYAVTASYDHTVRFWDVEKGRNTLVVHGFDNEMYTLGMLKDGILIGEVNGMMHVVKYER